MPLIIPSKRGRRLKFDLSKEQLNYLLDPETINRWAGLTLASRAVMFHRRYPEISINAYILRKVYQ